MQSQRERWAAATGAVTATKKGIPCFHLLVIVRVHNLPHLHGVNTSTTGKRPRHFKCGFKPGSVPQRLILGYFIPASLLIGFGLNDEICTLKMKLLLT